MNETAIDKNPCGYIYDFLSLAKYLGIEHLVMSKITSQEIDN
jgi:hypothetical protein